MRAATAMLLLSATLPVFGQAEEAGGPSIRVLLLTGGGNHAWRETSTALAEALAETQGIRCDVEPRPCRLRERHLLAYDCLITEYAGDRLGEEAEGAIRQYVEAGGGLVALHAALSACRQWEGYTDLVGAAWGAGSGHGFVHSFPVTVADPLHPIASAMPAFQHNPDELFHGLVVSPEAAVLLTAHSDPLQGGSGADEPVCWALRRGAGRVVGLTLGHDLRSHGIGLKTLLVRCVEWSATGRVTTPIPVVWPRAGMRMAQLEGFITGWYVTGPWPSPNKEGFDQTFPPEIRMDLADTYEVTIDGQPTPVGWKWVEGAEADGSLDFDIALGHHENIAVFAYVEVTVAQAQDVRLKVGSDDGVVVYVNGRKVHANNASRGVIVDQDVIDTRFVAGTNRLLFKVLQGGGLWGLVARITDQQDVPLVFALRTEENDNEGR